MSEYSELADRLEDAPTVGVVEMELHDTAATALRELEAENARLREAATRIRQMVDAQALDEGLWFKAETAAEAYLQQELRRLHAAIEAEPPEGE